MIEFGKTLRAAREAKGYTIGQIAEVTRLMPSMVDDLEKENFSRIAAPIYGRGFVKLYCEAVGLDPKPLVAEFMEIFSGNRDVAIKERPVSNQAEATPPEAPVAEAPAPAAPATEAPAVAAPVVEAPAVEEPAAETPFAEEPAVEAPVVDKTVVEEPAPQTDLFELVSESVPAPAPVPPAEPAAVEAEIPPQPDGLMPKAPQTPRLSRYADPVETARPERRYGKSLSDFIPNIPPIVWRVGALAIAALLILWLLLIGVKALYRATTTNPGPVERTDAVSTKVVPLQPATQKQKPAASPAVAPKPAAPAPKVKRTPQKIPSLYID